MQINNPAQAAKETLALHERLLRAKGKILRRLKAAFKGTETRVINYTLGLWDTITIHNGSLFENKEGHYPVHIYVKTRESLFWDERKKADVQKITYTVELRLDFLSPEEVEDVLKQLVSIKKEK